MVPALNLENLPDYETSSEEDAGEQEDEEVKENSSKNKYSKHLAIIESNCVNQFKVKYNKWKGVKTKKTTKSGLFLNSFDLSMFNNQFSVDCFSI